MAIAKLSAAFSAGEISPSLYGRYDLARLSVSATTARNGIVNFHGGWNSRAGTKFVGFSKQTGRDFPPRILPFRFSIKQGLVLEFGNFYMRVIQNGAFITEAPLAISGITNSDPAVVSSNGTGVTSATPINTGVLSTYTPGELITLAGGTFLTQAVLSVTDTELLSLVVNNPGSNIYDPGDTINLSGGSQTTTPVATVATTKVVSATITAGGTGGTPGTATVIGTTGTGTKFQAEVTINGSGIMTSVDSITLGGSYTVNPTAPAAEPVTGGSLSGAVLNVDLGVETVTISNPGVFTVNPTGGVMTQASSTGTGTGATFQQAILGPNSVSVANPGVYTIAPSNPVSQDFSDGTGLGAQFNIATGSVAAFNDGDWVFITGVVGMSEINGEIYVIDNSTPTSFELFDVYGNPIDSTAFLPYISGGTVSRIYTATAPYAEQDLPYLKSTQSKDVMSLCLVNQDSFVEYPPYDLTRFSNTDWQFIEMDPTPEVQPPTNVTGIASSAGTTFYEYVVTSVDEDSGTESIASDSAYIPNAVNIAAVAGALTISWTPEPGISQQNVYKATPAFGTNPPLGTLRGFVGYAFGGQFIDSNITADFTRVPPLFKNPFAPGQIFGASTSTAGTGYTTATVTINTTTGSGAELQAIIVNGGVVAYQLITPGKNYAQTDTITITGDGTGATAILEVGPESGTYPATVSYFQQRRVYGYSLNQPDTYWFSQPGAFTNYDSRIPTIDSDSITGSPWSVEVNGIQWMLPMPGGLVVFTGQQAWQLTGNGGSSLNPQSITPTSQQAQPQAYNGISPTVPPVRIDNDIVYVQAKGSIYRNLSYELLSNIYTGADLTLNSSQLFNGFTIKEHAWSEEPYKVLWAARNDGTALSLTFVKSQEVAGWARHDTNGYFESVCSITELPVDAVYWAVQRFPGDNTAYMIERQDNRRWASLDDIWCVDCGLSLPQPTPDATLRASSATGLGSITGVIDLIGGANYSIGTTARIIDDKGEGPGTGAIPDLTIIGGVITAVTFQPSQQGSGYIRPALEIVDPAGSAGGSGASANPVLNNSATFTASAAVFSGADIGSVIRMGGGIATVITFTDSQHVIGQITTPITDLRPNSGGIVSPQTSGNWTLTSPVSTISGLKYLAGATVTGVADGVEISPVVVPATGIIALPQPSTNVVVGLGFTAQLQSAYLNGDGSPTIQAQRKKVAAATFRVEASRGFEVGANQPDGGALNPPQIAPEWQDMKVAETHGVPPYGSTVMPLWTGDVREALPGGFDTRGQVALQQRKPFPLNCLSLVPEYLPGDLSDVAQGQK